MIWHCFTLCTYCSLFLSKGQVLTGYSHCDCDSSCSCSDWLWLRTRFFFFFCRGYDCSWGCFFGAMDVPMVAVAAFIFQQKFTSNKQWRHFLPHEALCRVYLKSLTPEFASPFSPQLTYCCISCRITTCVMCHVHAHVQTHVSLNRLQETNKTETDW